MDQVYFVAMLRGWGETIVIETLILLAALSPRHPWPRRLAAGVWLTSCTYPVVWLTLPVLLPLDTARGPYMVVAETFAPLAECALFWAAFDRGADRWTLARDWAAIVVANLASFGFGELHHHLGR